MSICVDPDEPFSAINLYVSGIAEVESIKVVSEFIKKSGGTETDTMNITTGQAFDIGHVFPIHLSASEVCDEACVEFTGNPGKSSTIPQKMAARFLSSISHREFLPRDSPRIGMPVPIRHGEIAPPVLLISIDSLRYDVSQCMEPILSAMDGEGIVPAEPRTKGHWTPPSHASMFTGVHPGDHKYVGVGDASDHPIHPDLTTLPELLTEHGYKCSGVTSHSRILPEGGFGRGFYRFQFQNMVNWLDRENDARTAVNQMLQWIERDHLSSPRSEGLFYFLHVFDPHMPYIPDHPSAAINDFDLSLIEDFSYHDDTNYDENLINTIRSYYDESVKYTARQLSRLISGMKDNNLFDSSLIIITGDHGELFGEFDTYGHTSLYDQNIRPYMIVKTPANADWSVPDTASTIDFLPTIATSIGASVPDQCQGSAWQDMSKERSFRITEAIKPESYQISVENEGILAVFTYPEQYPERPSEVELDNGPIEEEYYQLRDTRAGVFDKSNDKLNRSIKQRLHEKAETFVRRSPVVDRDRQRAVQPIEETEEQLRHLGYR